MGNVFVNRAISATSGNDIFKGFFYHFSRNYARQIILIAPVASASGNCAKSQIAFVNVRFCRQPVIYVWL
jgi:hypothetical protein